MITISPHDWVNNLYKHQPVYDSQADKWYIWDGINQLWIEQDWNFVPVTPPATPISNKITVTAGENINGGFAVFQNTDGKVYKFDITNPLCYGKYIGIAESSATIDAIFNVVAFGAFTEVGSGWTQGVTYYIGAGGLLTATPPVSGILKIAGVGISADTLLITDNTEFITI